MAVNLDKEAYYRRIKRLYGNWKVNAGKWRREIGGKVVKAVGKQQPGVLALLSA